MVHITARLVQLLAWLWMEKILERRRLSERRHRYYLRPPKPRAHLLGVDYLVIATNNKCHGRLLFYFPKGKDTQAAVSSVTADMH